MTAAAAPRARLDAPGGQAWTAFLHAHASLMRLMDRELERDAGLSLADFDVLIQLAFAAQERLRMSDLARRTLVSRSGTTRRVAQLEQAGLVARRGDDTDRRSVAVSLTPQGLEVLRRAIPVHAGGIARHFVDKLSDDEIARLGEILPKVITECDFG